MLRFRPCIPSLLTQPSTTFSHFINQLKLKNGNLKIEKSRKRISSPLNAKIAKKPLRNSSSTKINPTLKSFDRKANVKSNALEKRQLN